jgi:hypothetical protein
MHPFSSTRIYSILFLFPLLPMRTFRSGEANVPAIIVASGFLILCIAAAYYFIAVAPLNGDAMTDENSSSSSSSVSVVTSSAAMMDDGGDSSSLRSMTPSEQAAYDGCINAATEAHNQRWAAACENKKETQESAYLSCIQNKKDEDYCTAQFGGYENIDSNCDLGAARANALTLQYSAAKLACAQ